MGKSLIMSYIKNVISLFLAKMLQIYIVHPIYLDSFFVYHKKLLKRFFTFSCLAEAKLDLMQSMIPSI